VSEDATRCLVCGADLGTAAKPARPAPAIQGSRMPEITLSLPVALALLTLFLTIGAVFVFLALRNGRAEGVTMVPVTDTATTTITVTPSMTYTPLPPTVTGTPLPSPTPITYKVKPGETCAAIALFFGISVRDIVLTNNLSADCLLSVDQSLLIPQPTPTTTSLPTSTLSVAEQTEQACEKVDYVVQENDTLSLIAQAHGIPMEAIRVENGLPGDTVFLGQKLVIPLCKKPTPQGPTPTATVPPPYPAPNLLLPANGAPFTLSDDMITLQWAAVGTLREGERYMVTIEDVTEGQARKLVEYVTDTKFLIPASFRPDSSTPHVYFWWITTVRQAGTNEDGDPIWEPAGTASEKRAFSWAGVAAKTPTP
jgi:LysM repeat protein